MTLPKYKTLSLWSTVEKFNLESDETIAAWLEEAKKVDAENAAIYAEHYKAYSTMLELAKDIYGAKSKEVKYLDRSTPKRDYIKRYVGAWEYYNRYRKEYLEKKEREERIERNKKAKEEKERMATFAVWDIAKHYGIQVTSDLDSYELMRVLLESNRYLKLAHAMHNVRNDWNDGFDSVRWALNSFATDAKEAGGSILDNAIIDNISGILEGEETDGRVFRDTEWNYDQIYGLVDPQLLKDYTTLLELNSGY